DPRRPAELAFGPPAPRVDQPGVHRADARPERGVPPAGERPRVAAVRRCRAAVDGWLVRLDRGRVVGRWEAPRVRRGAVPLPSPARPAGLTGPDLRTKRHERGGTVPRWPTVGAIATSF